MIAVPPPLSSSARIPVLEAPSVALRLFLPAACLVAYGLITLRGRHVAIAPRVPERVAGALLVGSIVGAHLAGVLSDHGVRALVTPDLLFSFGSPLSSAGGFLGAACALGLSVRLFRLDWRRLLVVADLAAFAFPFAWLVARTGCALAHDHPGKLSTSMLAVPFPGGSRLDCGLLELLATPLLVALALWLSRRHPRPGLLTGTLALVYALLRFPLDFLRAADLPGSDPRYAGLTAAQWGAFVLAAMAIALLTSLAPRRSRQSTSPPRD